MIEKVVLMYDDHAMVFQCECCGVGWLWSVSQCVTVSVIWTLELVAVGKVVVVGRRGGTAGRCMSWGGGGGGGGSQHSRSCGLGCCGLGTRQDRNGNGRSRGGMNAVGDAKNLANVNVFAGLMYLRIVGKQQGAVQTMVGNDPLASIVRLNLISL